MFASSPPRYRKSAGLLACLVMLTPWAAHAEDQESLTLANGLRVTGTIQAYDERGVLLQAGLGRPKWHAHDQIVHSSITWLPIHQQAMDCLSRRDDERAIQLFRTALELETRPWARYPIEAGLIRGLTRSGFWIEAGERFQAIFRSRRDADVMSLAPIVWISSGEITDEVRGTARQWLSTGDPIRQLLAASWLLPTSQRDDARTVLDELQTVEPRIGWYARALLWQSDSQKPTDDELNRMQIAIDKMPMSVRAGPQFVFAEQLERAERSAESAIAYLWVAYIHNPGSDLAAEAMLRSARSARKADQPIDAHKIFEEVLHTFPGTAWATQAEQELADFADKDLPHG